MPRQNAVVILSLFKTGAEDTRIINARLSLLLAS